MNMPPEYTATGYPYRTRLRVLFAAEARKAVILRRGPRTHYCLINWDLETDTFTEGQWMKGNIKLYDLSPSGDKLIYWARQEHPSAVARRRKLMELRRENYDPIVNDELAGAGAQAAENPALSSSGKRFGSTGKEYAKERGHLDSV